MAKWVVLKKGTGDRTDMRDIEKAQQTVKSPFAKVHTFG
jgi:hypothetical protein